MVLAGIGGQARTIESRSIVVELARKKRDEHVEPLRLKHNGRLPVLAAMCSRWAQDNLARLRQHDPAIPDAIINRAGDNWNPLLAVADLAGGEWPGRARQIALSMTEPNSDDVAFGPLLLSDLREIYRANGNRPMYSNDLVFNLRLIEERPWEEFGGGKGLTVNKLARLLKAYKIKSTQIKIGGTNQRGYRAEQFADAWARYLPPVPTLDDLLNAPSDSSP
jgi:putative DNA primase/helicase